MSYSGSSLSAADSKHEIYNEDKNKAKKFKLPLVWEYWVPTELPKPINISCSRKKGRNCFCYHEERLVLEKD